jgi:hypothetical protein
MQHEVALRNSRLNDAVIGRVQPAGNVIETRAYAGTLSGLVDLHR